MRRHPANRNHRVTKIREKTGRRRMFWASPRRHHSWHILRRPDTPLGHLRNCSANRVDHRSHSVLAYSHHNPRHTHHSRRSLPDGPQALEIFLPQLPLKPTRFRAASETDPFMIPIGERDSRHEPKNAQGNDEEVKRNVVSQLLDA